VLEKKGASATTGAQSRKPAKAAFRLYAPVVADAGLREVGMATRHTNT